MNPIYLLSLTTTDGESWHTLSSLGYFTDEDDAWSECQRRNSMENGELTRWEVKTCIKRANQLLTK